MRSCLLASVIAVILSVELAAQQPRVDSSDFPVGATLRLQLRDFAIASIQGTVTGRRDVGGCLVLDLDTKLTPLPDQVAALREVGVLLRAITRTELRRPEADAPWHDVPFEAYARSQVSCLTFLAP